MPIEQVIGRIRRLRKLREDFQKATSSPQVRRYSSLSLQAIIPELHPGSVRWESPRHLLGLTDAIERAEREPVRILTSVPPRHGKTETLLAAAAWWLLRHPEQTVAYLSYSAKFARSKSRLARDYARHIGVQLRGDSTALDEWRTTAGGGFVATGLGGSVTGHGFNLLVVDDPHKNRAEAESSVIRDAVYEFCRGTAMSRIEPGGSVIVCHTRWHPDDVIGRLSRDREVVWDLVQHPAIDRAGNALWSSRWPAEALLKRKAEVGEYDWASLYQGQPRPRGGAVFQDVRYCEALPRAGYRIGVGIDLAYAARTSSDYSTIVVLLELGGLYYVAECIRLQCRAPEFKLALAAVLERHKAVPRWYCSGTEKGVADLIGGIDARPVSTDKFVRAQPVAAAWNAGSVQLLRNQNWNDALVSEVLGFTGVNDAHDDIVDAFAAAYDSLQTKQCSYSSLTEQSGW